jgi:hypothetical protein
MPYFIGDEVISAFKDLRLPFIWQFGIPMRVRKFFNFFDIDLGKKAAEELSNEKHHTEKPLIDETTH